MNVLKSSAHAGHTPNENRWGAVFALALGAFALVASEFLPVSLLTPIASDLSVTEGQAGQGIAVSGAFALVTSLFIASIVGKLDRKILLLLLTVLMILSGTVVALAPNYLIFMLGRALIGVSIGGFWSLSAATAMRLVEPQQVPRALAVVNGGNALAMVVAAPLGSFLGSIIGWRGAFFCIVPVALLALMWLLFSLPGMPAGHHKPTDNAFTLLKRPPVVLGMLAISALFMGQFALFTYLRPFLETVTQVGVNGLSLILLALGAAGLVGTILIGGLLQKGLYRILVSVPILMAGIALALVAFGSSMWATTLLLAVWGLVATAAPVAWWTWLARTLPDDAEAGGGLMVAVVQLAITLGAMTGGWVFDSAGYRGTFELSAAILLGAAMLAFVAYKRAAQPALAA